MKAATIRDNAYRVGAIDSMNSDQYLIDSIDSEDHMLISYQI